MTEHHGLDLAEIHRKANGHSIFAPSGSAMWLICSGSLIPNLLADDDAGIDAAYGTVGHEVGEEWLLRIDEVRDPHAGPISEDIIDECRPTYLVGKVVEVVEPSETFSIEIDDDMLAYVRRYIVWCAQLNGWHYIETRNFFSELTPLDDQGGTADHAACWWQNLVITDLKMGKGETVYAAVDLEDPRSLIDGPQFEGGLNGNPQAMIYAAAFFLKWDWLYDFQTITIRIAQPRIDHFQVWETTREELLRFMDFVKIRSHDAWTLNAPRTPSKKGCRWCKVKGSCAARAAWFVTARQNDTEGVFEPVVDADGVIEGQYTVVPETGLVTYGAAAMETVNATLEEDGFDPDFPNPGELSTAAMARLYPHRKLVEDWFKQMGVELTKRANDGDVAPGHKLVAGRDGNRSWKDPEDVLDNLDFLGLDENEAQKKTPLTPAQATQALRTKYGLSEKNAAKLLADLTYRAPGRPTLVPIADKREELEDLAGSVFQPVEDDDI